MEGRISVFTIKNNLLHQSASAWQWASDMKFIGDSNKSRMFDVNIDYSGTFSEPVTSIVTPINKKVLSTKKIVVFITDLTQLGLGNKTLLQVCIMN